MKTVAGRDIGGLAGRAGALRRLHTGPRPLVLPNAWDVASARLVAKAGFPVVATSSGAVAASLGYEDNDSMPVDEAFGVVARIARSVSVPVTADVEAGYRLPPQDLVERLLDARAVGCNLEDTDHHGDAGLVDAGEHAERLRAVRHAATEAGVDIVLNARVDVLRSAGDRRELVEEAVRRARLYLQAGADCVFPIRLADDELIGDFVRRVEGPVNIVAAGAPPLVRLAQLGVTRVSFAGLLMNQLYGAHEAKLSEIAAEYAADRLTAAITPPARALGGAATSRRQGLPGPVNHWAVTMLPRRAGLRLAAVVPDRARHRHLQHRPR